MRKIGFGLWILMLIIELFALLIVIHEISEYILVAIGVLVVTLVVGTVGMLSFKNDKHRNYGNRR